MSYLQAAFNDVLAEAVNAKTWYVCLMLRTTYYGGPEESGWWGHDSECEAYQEFPSEQLAKEAVEQINQLAEKLSHDARHSHSEHCARQMDWLDARGLDADYLPENDGPDDYYICVVSEVPTPSRGERSYS